MMLSLYLLRIALIFVAFFVLSLIKKTLVSYWFQVNIITTTAVLWHAPPLSPVLRGEYCGVPPPFVADTKGGVLWHAPAICCWY